jgi:LTXXQ motif family protein
MVDVAYGARDALPLPTPPRWPVVSPVAACEEDIDRHVALAAYMRSKLRLQGAQTEAWRRIEDAAVPALEALRSLCGEFPDPRASDRPIVEAISYGEKRLVAAAALLRAIREPARALYEMLSPDQRAALAPPAPPVRRHLPPGPPPLLGPPPM